MYLRLAVIANIVSSIGVTTTGTNDAGAVHDVTITRIDAAAAAAGNGVGKGGSG